MSDKFHISKDGNVRKCRAKTIDSCRATKTDIKEHFNTIKEAQNAYENSMNSIIFPKKFNNVSKIDEENDDSNDFDDLFDRALKRANPEAFEKIEKQLKYKREVIAKLTKSYEENRKPIDNIFYSLPYNSRKIIKYNKDYKKFESKITEDEKESIKNFTAISYLSVNGFLYSEDQQNYKFYNESSKELVFKTIKNLDTALEKAPSVKRTVYRAFSQDLASNEILSSEELANKKGYKVGESIEFKGFSSTTIDPSCIAQRISNDDEHTSIVFVIETSKGAPTDLTPEDGSVKFTQDSEREILLPRNSKFKVSKVKRSQFFYKDGETSYEPLTVFLQEE